MTVALNPAILNFNAPPLFPDTHPLLMRGFTRVRQHIAAYLSVAVPELITLARNQWDLTQYELPFPIKYDWYDPTLAQEFPAIGLIAGNDGDHKHQDITNKAAVNINTRYNVRMFVLAASPNDADGEILYYDTVHPKEMALRLRDDLTGIVQAALFANPGLGRDDISMNPESLQTDYLEPFQFSTQNERWVAASTVAAEFRFSQYTRGGALGTVQETNIHPALM